MGLLGENRKLFARLIYVDRVLFNKISFMKTISVLVLLQRNVYVQRQKSTLFHLKTQDVNVLSYMYSNYAYSPDWSLYFVELFEKGSEIHKKRRCFYLCVMSNAFIFDGFLSMGDICFSIYISKNRGMVLIDVLFLLECWE